MLAAEMENKLVNLLKTLNGKECESLENISNSLGVSKRSVCNYIKQINKDLKNVVQIKNRRGKGYYLLVINENYFQSIINENLDYLDSDSFPKRVGFIIEKLMNNRKKCTLDDLAFEMNVSRTTLVNDIKKASVVLGAYNLNLYGIPNKGMFISGEEISLRNFIIENVYDYIYGYEELDAVIEQFIFQIAKKYDYDSETTERLKKSITIMLDRVKKGHMIQTLDENYKKLIGSEEFAIALEIKEKIEEIYPIKLSINELLFITVTMTSRRTPISLNAIGNISVPPQVKEILKDIKDRIAFEMNIYFGDADLSEDIGYHLTFLINRLLFNVQNTNPLLQKIKHKYPLAFKMAEIAGDVIEENLGKRPSDDELGYLAFYFELYLSEQEIRLKNFRKVAVICSTGRGTAKIIAIQIRKILGSQPDLDIYSEKRMSEVDWDQYDLIFTTIPISLPNKVPIIKITEIFDETAIAKKIDKVIYLKNYSNGNIASNRFLITALMDQDRFFFFPDPKNYRESMLTMAHSLIESGYVDSGFSERLIQREEKSTMVFDRFIAVPHTINKATNQIVLAIGIFPNPVKEHD